jgi:hypothetical protein
MEDNEIAGIIIALTLLGAIWVWVIGLLLGWDKPHFKHWDDPPSSAD